jgi:TonB-linked SusC/RagA family outer membrane protein
MYKFYAKQKGVPPGYVRKLFLVMRLTTVLLFISLMQLSAKTLAQRVTLDERGVPLEKVLEKVRRQSGFDIFFDRKILDGNTVSVKVSKVSPEEAIKAILTGLPLKYLIDGKSIVINESSFMDAVRNRISDLLKPALTITGRVINRKAESLGGTQVIIKRTGKGTSTDEQGMFSLKDLENTDSIVFSYIGYKTKTVAVPLKSPLTVVMEEATNGLDEVKIMGYGTTTQRLTTGNITSVRADEIARQPVMNPLLALQGRVPGLEITSGGYEAGPVQIEIRGRQALNTSFSSDPLYIVDGVPLTVLEVGNALGRGLDVTSISPAGGQSPLFSLNNADIESIDVLKDADATAIYGSRGANGVILITTKRGKPGITAVDLNVSQGLSLVSGKWDMLNTEQFLAMRKEAFANDGKTPTPATAGDIFNRTDQQTDWQEYLWGGTGQWTNLQAGLSGGTQLTTFRLSGGYNSTKDITVSHGDNIKASFAVNLQNKSANQRFTTTASLNYSYVKINQISQGISVMLAPNAPSPYNSSGGPNMEEWRAFNNSYNFSNLFQPYENTTKFITGNVGFSYVIVKGLTAKINFGYNNSIVNNILSQPALSKFSTTNDKQTGNALFGVTQVNNWIAEPQLSYSGQVGKGRLNLLLGGTYQDNATSGNRLSGSGYTNDALLGSISAAPIVTAIDNSAQYKYAGIFARAGYNFENKYILNLNGRRDGSSRFGPGKRFGNFWSVGAAWVGSEENFFKEFVPKEISFFKFRASYGITGSDNVGDYKYISLYGNLTPVLPTYNGITPLLPQLMGNENFHWQENKKFEAAIDISFLGDRINLEAAYYSNRCDNQLISFPIPSYTGFTSVVANSPADVRNSGWEFTLDARLVSQKNFSYNMTFNFGMNKNILLAYPGLETSPYANIYRVGEPLSIVFLYNYMGVDPLTGQYAYEDITKDGKISATSTGVRGVRGDDRYVPINTAPKFSGGWGHQFSYKNFSLNAYFTFRKQIGQNAIGRLGGGPNIALEQYLGRWQKVGDIAQYARLTTTSTPNDINYSVSTAAYSDASFIRLQNVAISWALPKPWAKKVGMSGLNVNFNAQNILVITGYKGMDPGVQIFGSMPLARTFTAGLSCSF